MKSLFYSIIILFFPVLVIAQSNNIIIPVDKINKIEDLNLLQSKYNILSDKDLPGIHMCPLEDLNLTKNQINQVKGKSTSFIVLKENESIYFGCQGVDSYQNAYYYLLYKLGYRFLGFNDDWIIKPTSYYKLDNINEGVVSRDINSIIVGFTGGTSLDKIEFKKYEKRNFLSFNYAGARHDFSRTIFYRKNKNYIDKSNIQNPNNPILYKNIIPNLDNPLTLPLIKKWALERVDSGLYPKGFSISPADGIGDGTQTKYNPASISEITNLYEIGWYVATEIAKYIKEVRPRYKGKIIMNAYGDGLYNVQPPKFTIPDNMSIMLIPYAFQKVYMTDWEMFDDWRQKQKKENFAIQVYDYWSPTVWTGNGLPYQNLYENIKNRVKVWEKYPIENLNIESTGFTAITAPYYYVFGHYNQNITNSSFDELFDEYFNLAYKDVAPIIKSIYLQDFSPRLSKDKLDSIIKKISKAYSINKDKKVANRIQDLMSYVVYLHYYFVNKENKSLETYEKLVSVVEKNYRCGFFQYTTVLNTNYGDIKPSKKYKLQPRKLNFKKNKAIVNEFTKVAALNTDNIINSKDTKASRIDLRNFKVFAGSKYTFKPYTARQNIFSFMSKFDQKLVFNFKAKKFSKIRIVSDDIDKIFQFDINETRFEYDIKKNKKYTIYINHRFESFTLPETTLFVIEKHRRKLLHSDMKYFFYVPSDVTEIIYDSKDKDARFQFGETLMYPKGDNGKYIKIGYPEDLGNGLFKYYIPPEYRGRVWKTNQQHDSFKILNFNTIKTKQEFSI